LIAVGVEELGYEVWRGVDVGDVAKVLLLRRSTCDGGEYITVSDVEAVAPNIWLRAGFWRIPARYSAVIDDISIPLGLVYCAALLV